MRRPYFTVASLLLMTLRILTSANARIVIEEPTLRRVLEQIKAVNWAENATQPATHGSPFDIQSSCTPIYPCSTETGSTYTFGASVRTPEGANSVCGSYSAIAEVADSITGGCGALKYVKSLDQLLSTDLPAYGLVMNCHRTVFNKNPNTYPCSQASGLSTYFSCFGFASSSGQDRYGSAFYHRANVDSLSFCGTGPFVTAIYDSTSSTDVIAATIGVLTSSFPSNKIAGYKIIYEPESDFYERWLSTYGYSVFPQSQVCTDSVQMMVCEHAVFSAGQGIHALSLQLVSALLLGLCMTLYLELF